MKAGMRHAANVPQLQHHAPAGRVHGVGHAAPAVHLCFAVNARREAVALALWRDLRGLGNDEAGAGALRVVGGHEFVGHVAGLAGAAARHGRHHQAVGQVQRAELEGAKQR